MSVTIDSGLFARLAGRYDDKDVLLFEVNGAVAEAMADDWSQPVQLRFVRAPGALCELEVRECPPATEEIPQ